MAKNTRKLNPEEVIAAEDALMDFQFAVIDALNEKGITQAEFAQMLGVTRARVSQMLSSEANPTIKLVGRALDTLGLKADYIAKRNREEEFDECDSLPILDRVSAQSDQLAWSLSIDDAATSESVIEIEEGCPPDSLWWAGHSSFKLTWAPQPVGANSNHRNKNKLAAA